MSISAASIPTQADQDRLVSIMKQRPNSYGWTIFQRLSLYGNLFLGAVFLVFSILKLVQALEHELLLIGMKKALKEKANEQMIQVFNDYFLPTPYYFSAALFLLAIACFLLSLYARKVIQRNLYIVTLEKAAKVGLGLK